MKRSWNREKRDPMESVEFRDMEYVMAVHEEQSFSGAARKHFISQPVLSRVVAEGGKKPGGDAL